MPPNTNRYELIDVGTQAGTHVQEQGVSVRKQIEVRIRKKQQVKTPGAKEDHRGDQFGEV